MAGEARLLGPAATGAATSEQEAMQRDIFGHCERAGVFWRGERSLLRRARVREGFRRWPKSAPPRLSVGDSEYHNSARWLTTRRWDPAGLQCEMQIDSEF